jgi:predicted ATPase
MHISSITLRTDLFPAVKEYPFNLPVFRKTRRVDFKNNVTFFAGENGSGKSTLLRAIARKCGIHIWAEDCWARAHYNPHENSLFQFISICWTKDPVPGAFFSAEIYEHMTKMIDVWASTDPKLLDYFGGKSLLEQSHGESFMSFFTSRYTLEGVYFLDEPETALSPKRQLSFVKFLEDTGHAGHAQFLVSTHSPILLSCPGATILSFDGDTVHTIPYEATEHYRVYREFIMNRHDNGVNSPCTS